MNSNPCKVCGGTDLCLADGFYYCVECGTQDVNVRETIVEQTVLADGTFAHTTVKKLTTVHKEAIEMSPEWNKWHAYNFILSGLTGELMRLGAEPSVKTTILWIWTEYIKKFQVKQDEQMANASLNNAINSYIEDKNEDTEDDNDKSSISSKSDKKKNKNDRFRWDITVITKGTLLTILYIALNLDKSEIQLSHLLRFIKEGRLSLYTCKKFIPEEINTKSIPHWKNFILCQNDYTPKIIRTIAMTFFKRLDIGVPLVPDLTKIIGYYVKELCLPNEFKDLVLSLMNLMPCDFLKLDHRSIKSIVRLPDYEGVCMSYVLVALKMCFGLDADYEIRVSEAVQTINDTENFCKSYKIASYSEPTDRLLSFQEWYKFLLFRKTILCKYYFPMARLYKLPVDECVLMEQLKDRKQRPIRLSDSVTMDILNKIQVSSNVYVISEKEFPPTLTPMTTYSEVIMRYQQDPDFRLLLSEDFSQYSLKYCINDLNLPGCDEMEHMIQGVSELNKTINKNIIGTLLTKAGDTTLVYVRNCENKNWLRTKPPTIHHVVKASDDKQNSDKESDQGYDSNFDNTPPASNGGKTPDCEEIATEKPEEKVFETFDEEEEGVCIFDDNFKDFEILQEDKKADSIVESNESFEYHNEANLGLEDSKEDVQVNLNEECNNIKDVFDPNNFDRDTTIRKLLENACCKYKIQPCLLTSVLRENKRYKKKRKLDNQMDETQAIQVKRKRKNYGAQEIIDMYYKSIEKDDLSKLSDIFMNVPENQGEKDFDTLIPEKNKCNDFGEPEINEEIFANNELGNQESVISSIYLNDSINNTLNDDEENEIFDNPITQTDPKFDPKTHDINQLYVKIPDNQIVDLSSSLKYDSDPEFYEIIERNIQEFRKSERKRVSDSDSDDDLPLSELVKEQSYFKKNREKIKCEHLVTNPNLNNFNYWMRHYKSRAMSRCLDMNEKFDIELLENCPKSFVFVIRECAAILDCTTFTLYKCMQNLEETMLRHCKNTT